MQIRNGIIHRTSISPFVFFMVLVIGPCYFTCSAKAQSYVDFSNAVIFVDSDGMEPMLENAARVLAEEVEKRTGLVWERVDTAPVKGAVVVITLNKAGELEAEGYRVTRERNGGPRLLIEAANARITMTEDLWQSTGLQTDPKAHHARITRGAVLHYLDAPLNSRYWIEDELLYEHLDPEADYLFRVAGNGDSKPRAVGELLEPSFYDTSQGGFKDFPVIREYYADGTLKITFDRLDERHLNWRDRSYMAEVWLLKQ